MHWRREGFDVRRCGRRFCAKVADWLRRSCWSPPAAVRPARRSLVIALRPSVLVRRLEHAFTVVQLLYAAELWLLGHDLAGLMVVMLAVACRLYAHGRRVPPAQRPDRLVLTAQGRIHLLTPAGGVEEVRLARSSLRLGSWLLLCLECCRGRRRLLLGPHNLDEDHLAALHRCLVLVDQSAQSVAPGIAPLLLPAEQASEPVSRSSP